MFFDAQQTLEAVQAVETPRIVRQSSTARPFLLGVLVGVVLGRKSK